MLWRLFLLQLLINVHSTVTAGPVHTFCTGASMLLSRLLLACLIASSVKHLSAKHFLLAGVSCSAVFTEISRVVVSANEFVTAKG